MGSLDNDELRPLTVLGADRPLIPFVASIAGEPQPSWAELHDELTAYPYEPRAVFFNDTVATDCALYCEWRADDNCWRSEMDIPDDRLVPMLLDAGARVTEHDIEFPSYHSRHDVQAGKRFSVDLFESTLHYVPHWSIGDEWGAEWEHTVTMTWSSVEHHSLVEELTRQLIDQDGIHEREFFVTVDDQGREKLETFAEDWYDSDDVKRRRKLQRAALEMGKTVWRGRPIRFATRRDILRSDEYVRIRGSYYGAAYSARRNDTIFETSRLLARLGELEVAFRSTHATVDVRNRRTRDRIAEAVSRKITLSSHETFSAETLAERLTRSMKIVSRKYTSRLTIPHEAPFSERGRLWIDGVTPEEATIVLTELGIIGDMMPEVAYETLYGDRCHRRGRLTPILEEFLAGATLSLPPDTMVLHGLTGASNRDDDEKRFESICRSGGLMSIAERRRLGIDVRSMSPIGDIASGIDQGVSATIGTAAHYGGSITFIMKPTVLCRRDCWFSDQDFGGSNTRYEYYNSYAQQIGQERIYLPPSVRSRARHIRNGTRQSDNEVYLKHHVRLEEIDAIAVEGKSATRIRHMAKRLRSENIMVPPVVVCQSDWEEKNLPYPTVKELVTKRHRAWGGMVRYGDCVEPPEERLPKRSRPTDSDS